MGINKVITNPFPAGKILVVDDEASIIEILEEYLLKQGFEVQTAENGFKAVEAIKDRVFDVIITDLAMPGMNGFELIKIAGPIQPLTPFIVLTGRGTAENAINALKVGAYDFLTKPIRDLEKLKFCVERGMERKRLLSFQITYQRNLEEMVASQTNELIRKNRELLEKNVMLENYAQDLESVSLSVISSLQAVLEEKDAYTAGHSRRVTQYALMTADYLNLDQESKDILKTAAELHDIGKLIVDVHFINKPGPLTAEEWDVMRRHPDVADRFLRPLPFLEKVRPLIRHHHERLDGSGYPDGLVGVEVTELTMILSVADCYDAITTDRSYRPKLGHREAISELRRSTGGLLDAGIVEALVTAIG